MKTNTISLQIKGITCTLQYQIFKKKDKKILQNIFKKWMSLSKLLKSNGATRTINIPELLTEGLFCFEMNTVRKLNVNAPAGFEGSFDTIDLIDKKRQQIKASSSQGPSSFGPTTFWDADQLFFMDFAKNGEINGEYEIYQIPDSIIFDLPVNRAQTLTDQQRADRRPRTNLRALINENRMIPIKCCSVF